MALVPLVRVGVRVHAEVGPGNDPEGRNIQRQVVEVVEYPDRDGTAPLVPEYLRAVGLAVRMEADPRRAGLGPVVGIVNENQAVAEQLLQEPHRGFVGDEFGQLRTGKMWIPAAPLFFAVVPSDGFESIALRFQLRQVVLRDPVRDDQVALLLDHPYTLALGEGAPVPVVHIDLLFRLTVHHPSFLPCCERRRRRSARRLMVRRRTIIDVLQSTHYSSTRTDSMVRTAFVRAASMSAPRATATPRRR